MVDLLVFLFAVYLSVLCFVVVLLRVVGFGFALLLRLVCFVDDCFMFRFGLVVLYAGCYFVFVV